jgi:hypothetical protein
MGVNPISNLQSAATGTIQSAIALASQKTGIDFSYLLGQAQVESGFRANAHATTSSASGLYQFVDQSWLAVVKQHGAEHGLGWAADAIQPGANGRLTVSDPQTRQAILDLRNDPQTAALMAAEHASDNKVAIEQATGRPATGTDLYMAHFLGLGGARSFLTNMAANPDRTGASLFPAAARSNHNIFYGSDGQPRTLSEIYDRFSAKLDRGAASVGATGLASSAIGGSAIFAALNNGSGTDTEVIPGTGDTSASSATRWANATIDQLNGGARTINASALRPTPDTARLAYLLLARLGG